MLHLTPLEETVAGREVREMGRQEGLAKGELIGRIVAFREMLEQTPVSTAGLQDLSTEQLEEMLRNLKARMRA